MINDSSNQSFDQPPDDGGKLKRESGAGPGQTFLGRDRTYSVVKKDNSDHATVQVKFNGMELPQTEKLNLASVKGG